MKSFFLFIFAVVSSLPALAQLACSPMIGYTEMREAFVWVQTEAPGKVVFECFPENNTTLTQRHEVETTLDLANVAHFSATNLEPGETYVFRLIVDETVMQDDTWMFTTQPLWQYREEPPAFTLATGSCAFINEERYDRPGKPYGSDYGIFERIADADPNLMLWLGDNIYLREPDWGSRSGILHRYSHMRSLPEMQSLLTTCPHYAIWDDHDFGPNNADRSFIHKDWTLEAFELFWGNPSYGLPDLEGITGQFTFADVDFFLMDNRYHRSNYELETTPKQIWGEQQVDWLIEALKFSRAPFKIVATGGQFLSDAALYENHAQYAEERQRVLDRIEAEGITGVVFLSGDRHHTELSMLELANGNAVYDLTVSPLTSRAYDHSDEPNSHRVKGTIVGEHNYALLSFDGPRKERVLTIRVYDKSGKELWSHEIEAPKR